MELGDFGDFGDGDELIADIVVIKSCLYKYIFSNKLFKLLRGAVCLYNKVLNYNTVVLSEMGFRGW